MEGLVQKIQAFIDDLRDHGILVNTSQAEECYRALGFIDWSEETIFYSALFCTLLKESALIPIFTDIYIRHFRSFPSEDPQDLMAELEGMLGAITSPNQGYGGEGMGNSEDDSGPISKTRPRQNQPTFKKIRKDPMTQGFYTANLEDIRLMESLVPLLAKRLVSKMVMKKRKNQRGYLDYRQTLRKSMSSGGVPVDIYIKKRLREKPVIFALCDVSVSCLEFSFFSLAMVNALEKFFRQVRSFAFIGETDEITSILKTHNYSNLRPRVMQEADVAGKTGYTDYGQAFITFNDRYGKDLSYKSYVLIFGDARTNWFNLEKWVLKDMQRRVKRIYWFNPEPKSDWGKGDSSMDAYARYCDKVFECSNLDQLSRAICEL